MSRQRYPLFADQMGAVIQVARVTGASVATSPSSAGLDGRGKFLCNVSKGTGGTSNQVTIDWLVSYADVPYVIIRPLTANCYVQHVSATASQLVVKTVQSDSNGTAVNDADFELIMVGYNLPYVVS